VCWWAASSSWSLIDFENNETKCILQSEFGAFKPLHNKIILDTTQSLTSAMSLNPQTILKLKDRILPAHNNDSWWPRWQLELNLSLNEVVSLKNLCKPVMMPVAAPVKGDRLLFVCVFIGFHSGVLQALSSACYLNLVPPASYCSIRKIRFGNNLSPITHLPSTKRSC
jgi:hypothetical protein